MIKLEKILTNIEILETQGMRPLMVNELTFDSRKVSKDDVYFAVKGTQVDGHDFIPLCIENGASVIVCQEIPKQNFSTTYFVKVADSSKALGIMASNFYDNPSSKLSLVGITGTNGKTSTVTMLYNLFRSLGYSVGLLSTVKNKINNRDISATHTTPDAIQINKLLNEMVENACEYCFMEVSSHALVQNRVAGLNFKGAIFSNITHDHLDFHKTFAEYIKAKKIFFDNLSKDSFALINIDDRNGLVMAQNSLAKLKTYSIKTASDYRAKIMENSFEGLLLNIDGSELLVPLVGSFNAYNILAVYSAAMELGSDKTQILSAISKIETAEGRFETMKFSDGIVAIVDYAHTPDALENVLNTINKIRTGKEQLITVVGAGGNRDKTKRPEMAAIAAKLSDKVILTSDNPRNEEPEDIIHDMEKGITAEDEYNVISIINRREAIKTACTFSQKDSIILVAGKGHEKYQDIKGVKHRFDDKEILMEYLK
ncbi:MAG: UDP-N-acetylmuramoyl-L-alanyl-D-glutamate--2,6-diaminopimelate ligase [Bacteroidetes bacterium CG2_30_33_31]|nr:MAG: UDP-N-acetylmuramoyl-L-alanyl-D-glutamate--2,6-diaminopimelate ligase [Bacteroidetes bacterium CG2_30_33_31]